jgi:GTPase SAR1 family protein
MGLCGSTLTEEQRRAIEHNKQLEQVNANDYRSEQEKMRLLLLGAGESGKSTIFKQMKILYGQGFSEETRLEWKEAIQQNAMNVMQAVCDAVVTMGFQDEIVNREAFNKILELQPEHDLSVRELTPEVAEAINTLWTDERDVGIKKAWERRSEYQVVESNIKYIQDIARISAPGYIPTDADILLSRVRTTGIVEESYIIDKINFIIIDVGGQRNERKKWMHLFDTVNAVIFVAALSEYDQMLYEDETANRMVEAITLFEAHCNNKFFEHIDMILFLNKRDLFESKIARKAIETVPDFKDYTGKPNDYEDGCKYFLQKFKSMNKNPSKDIFHHVTCATDTDNVRVVFNACRTIILKKSLIQSGFLD